MFLILFGIALLVGSHLIFPVLVGQLRALANQMLHPEWVRILEGVSGPLLICGLRQLLLAAYLHQGVFVLLPFTWVAFQDRPCLSDCHHDTLMPALHPIPDESVVCHCMR